MYQQEQQLGSMADGVLIALDLPRIDRMIRSSSRGGEGFFNRVKIRSLRICSKQSYYDMKSCRIPNDTKIQVALKARIGHGYRQQECSLGPFLIYDTGIERVGLISVEALGAGSSDMDGAIRPQIDRGHQTEEIATERAFEEHELLLEKIMEKLDALLRSLTQIDKEFSHMIELTESYKYSESFEDGVLRNSYGLKIMCGLLKLKNNLIRWGFLFVLERLLMRCKFLLDESELQHSVGNEDHEKTCLDKAMLLWIL
ncbi:hypothetical protein Tco_1255598 [Tanacetum coccineum]